MLSLLLMVGTLQAQVTSEFRGGRWVDVTAATTQASEPMDPALIRIEQMLRDHRNSEAMKATVNWLKVNKGSPFFDRGLYLEAQALYQYGDRMKAFFYLDELLDEYPESPLYYQALEKQYDIADAYLNGYKRRFMRIPMLGAEEEAVEMLFRIQARAPKSPIAEKSLLRTADYYYADGQYDLATDAYRVYYESYKTSPYAPRALLRQAYSNLAQFRGLKFDATPVIDAKTELQQVIQQYPDLAAQENIPSIIERIDNTFARKLYVTADFYTRTHEPRAATYIYQQLVKLYPQTPEAAQARVVLARAGATTMPTMTQ